MRKRPVERMFSVFVCCIIFIIAAVAVFNFVIFEGRPVMMASRSLGEVCDEEQFCFEPLRCVGGQCVLVVSEKGGRCNDADVRCAEGMVCGGGVCKQVVGARLACDERSFQVCSSGFFCFDGVCRSLFPQQNKNI